MGSLLDLIKIHVRAAWRRKWYAIGAAWLVCVGGWIGLSRIPDQYESNARLYVDTDAVLVPLLHGLAADTATASQAERLQKTLLSRSNLDKLVAMSHPGLAGTPEIVREQLRRHLSLSIQISSTARDLFTLTYRDSNPHIAYNVVKGILSIFVENQAEAVKGDIENAQKFLQEQIASYETKLEEAERRRAEFRTKYLDMLPGDGSTRPRLQVTRDELARLHSEYADTELRLIVLRRQLAGIPQFLAVDSGLNILAGGVVTNLSPAQQQLMDAQRNLQQLRLKFTEKHPDLIAAEKLVAMLRASQPGAASEPTGRSMSNPVYEQVRLQVIDKETNLASLKAKIVTVSAEVERLDKMVREVPNIEAQYAQLDRDYSVLQHNHSELVARLERARIAAAANESADNKVRIVDQPQMPQVPLSPKRALMTSGVLAAGLAAGVAVVFLIQQFDRSFTHLAQLRRLGLPVLGKISFNGAGRSWRSWSSATCFVISLMLLLVVYAELVLRASGLKLAV